jgi:AbrB family looped-hinge helix DNA binding protein
MEERFVARVFQDGKVTIPKDLRDKLDIKDGDYVSFIFWKTEISRPSEKK